MRELDQVVTNEPIYTATLNIDGLHITTTDTRTEVIRWMGRWVTYTDFNAATLFRIESFVEHRHYRPRGVLT